MEKQKQSEAAVLYEGVGCGLRFKEGKISYKKTNLQWTEYMWNPITGCTKISDGCKNCCAESMAKRLKGMAQTKYNNVFEPTFHRDALCEPFNIGDSSFIFVCSMGDIFHEQIRDKEILKIFKVMNDAGWHTFQVLTKRPKRLLKLADKINWTSNIWVGITVEDDKYKFRIDDLRKIEPCVRFISFEPLLGEIKDLNLNGIDWVIVGGENGNGAREMKKEWVLPIQKQCEKKMIPFFFKGWGGYKCKKKHGTYLNGRQYHQIPEPSFLGTL